MEEAECVGPVNADYSDLRASVQGAVPAAVYLVKGEIAERADGERPFSSFDDFLKPDPFGHLSASIVPEEPEAAGLEV